MENIYLFMIIALAVLAIADLIVGVSNDAINFLNSAIGSKAISLRTIMIFASLGIFVGAVYSSGLMEVARKGIFIPAMFNFDEIMYIFMAVMITDILLLDEILAVGDQGFRQKAREALRERLAPDKTVILVHHMEQAIKEICHRAVWLEQGQVRDDGSAAEVLAAYSADANR